MTTPQAKALADELERVCLAADRGAGGWVSTSRIREALAAPATQAEAPAAPHPPAAVQAESIHRARSFALLFDELAGDLRAGGDECGHERYFAEGATAIRALLVHLAATPPQPPVAQPLTVEQATALWHASGSEVHNRRSAFEWFYAGIVVGEYAHGITPQQQQESGKGCPWECCPHGAECVHARKQESGNA